LDDTCANRIEIWTISVFLLRRRSGRTPHVHIERDGDIAKFWLKPVRLHSSGGFNRPEIARLTSLVIEHRTDLLVEWNAYFND